jgi:hypothetical protein
MRIALVALLGIALLCVLWWRSDVPPAPVAIAESARAGERASAATVEAAALPAQDATPAPSCEREPARSREPIAVAATALRGRVHGRLVDPLGRAVTGAVLVWAEPDAKDGPARGGLELAIPDAPPHTVTPTSGTFDVELPTGRRFALVGRADGFACSSLRYVALTDAEPSAFVMLRLEELTEIRGRIVDDRGVPIAAAVLTLRPDVRDAGPGSEELYGALRAAVSDADGVFAFEELSPHATFVLTYVPEARGAVRCTRNGIRAGDRDVRFVVSSDELRTGSVSGVVRGADGAPLRRFQIAIGPCQSDVDDAAGRFRLEGLPWGGELPILVTDPNGWGRPRCVGVCRVDRATQELELRVQPPGALAVVVRDAAGVPVPSAAVVAFLLHVGRIGGDLCSTDAEGVARFAALDPGSYEITANAVGQTVAARAEVHAGSEASAEIWLARPGALTVSVRDAAGAPVEGVSVAIEPQREARSELTTVRFLRDDGPVILGGGRVQVFTTRGRALALDPWTERAPPAQTTDARGVVRYASVAPGRYRVSATLGAAIAEAAVEVRAGGAATADLRIERR